MISYYKYYLELQNRGMLLFCSWFSILIVCYLYKETILFVMINLSNFSETSTEKPYFIFTNVSEVFYVYLEIIFFIANQIGLIMFLYHLIMFLSFGLYRFEFTQLKLAFQFFLITWLVSLTLLTKLIIPYSWAFFLNFQQTDVKNLPISFFFEARIIEYFEYFKSLYYICLINCQLLAFLTLFLTNITKELNKTKTSRKLFYFIFVIFSTLTTPPDVISQIALSTTLICTYEVLIFWNYLKT